MKDWIKNAVIYHILIDRFAGYDPSKNWNEPHFIGGNIKGIIDSLPYLKNLGVTALWISPFYKTSAYHGYHITDFFEVDSHFGNKKDLKRLIDLVHQNNMHIIADFVPNHVSSDHPYFLDACSSKDSYYYDWFYFTEWPKEYLSFLSVKELPKLNVNNDETKNHIIKAAKYWLSFGIDGYRLDHVIGLSNTFWKEFNKQLKKSFPETILIGEAWMQGISWNELNTIQIPFKRLKWLRKNSSDNVLRNYIHLLDGVLDFTTQQLFHQYLCKNKNFKDKLKKTLKAHFSYFPSDFLLPVFLDNHDMDRFLFNCNNDINLFKEVAKIQFSLPQPIIIFYGTEQKMTQKKSVWTIKNHGDLLARMPMPWIDNEDNELYHFYRKLIRKRLKT